MSIALNNAVSSKFSTPPHAATSSFLGVEPINKDASFAALQKIGVKVRVAGKATIFNEGDDAKCCYKVVSGAVRLCKHTSNGRRQVADFLLAGDFFGFLQPGAYSFTAEAVSDVVLIAYPRAQVEQLCDTMPSMSKRLLSVLCQRLLSMQDHLVMLGRQNALERIASFLLLIAERSDAEDGDMFELPMSRRDMADYLGLTIETVSRTFTDLKKLKAIRMDDAHRIVIPDMDALRTMADSDV